MRGLVSSVVLLCVVCAVAYSQAPRRDIVVPPPHWNRIVGKPTTFPPGVHTQDWSTITGTPTTVEGYGITNAFDGSYTNLTDVPATFPPSAHQHNYTDITNAPWKTEAELDLLYYSIANPSGYLNEAAADLLYLSITNNFLQASVITNLLDAKEDALGNPGVDDYVLSSKVDGTRSWVENAGGASLTNELGGTITHATTNETSTSETEVLTAGAVARAVTAGQTTFTNLVWVSLEKDDYDFTQADTFTVHTGTWTSFDIGSAVNTNHNIVAIMIEQRARGDSVAKAFGTKPSAAAAAQRNTVMCPIYTTSMMIFVYGVVWLNPGDPWTMYYYSNLTGTSGTTRLAWLTVYGYWHEVTINE